MGRRTSYHPGGYDASKTSQNRAEEWDSASGYTRWTADGGVAEQRALTADEAAILSTQDAAATAANNDSTLRQQAAGALANLRTIRDAPQVSVTSLAQAQTVCRQLQTAIQSEAAVLIRLGRLILGQTDGTD